MKKFKNVTKKINNRYTLAKGLCYYDKDDNDWLNVGWFGVNDWIDGDGGCSKKENVINTLEKIRREHTIYWCDVVYDNNYDGENGNETVLSPEENVTDMDIETIYQLFQYSWANIENLTNK